MREIRSYGSARGVRSNPYPYRDILQPLRSSVFEIPTAFTQPVLPVSEIRLTGGSSLPYPASAKSSVVNSGSLVPSASVSNVKPSPSGLAKNV